MTHDLYEAIFRVASVLEVPVIIVALLALALVVVETGRFGVELASRRRRRSGAAGLRVLDTAARAARVAAEDGDGALAERSLHEVAWSSVMDAAYAAFVSHLHEPNLDNRLAKELADVDNAQQRRLGVTRLLVRIGPALGLMGTLIPLSPALDGLAKGDTGALTENLRIAFSITVLGIFVGAVAFALSLVRDRLYGQDYSDLEYVASVLSMPVPAERTTTGEVSE